MLPMLVLVTAIPLSLSHCERYIPCEGITKLMLENVCGIINEMSSYSQILIYWGNFLDENCKIS